MSGLEGLAGTPVRTESPAVHAPQQSNNLDDLLGVFGNGGANNVPSNNNNSNLAALEGLGGTSSSGFGGSNDDDLMNGFSSLNVSANDTPTSPGSSGGKKTNEDILSLF